MVIPLKYFSSRHIIGNGYHQRDKIQAKPDKIKHEMESVKKSKVNQSQQKVNPVKFKVKDGAKDKSSDSLQLGIRFSTLGFMNSSDSVAGMVSRCSSPILRESSGSTVGKSSVIAIAEK
nr:hypothetical protein [Tanacetum cinerariifolium]